MSDAMPAVTETESMFRASDGLALHAYEWSSREADVGPAPVIVVMHGYAEHCGRYRELARELVRAGYLVTGFDARGHGRSGGQRGHVRSYDRYVDDLHGFMLEVQRRRPHRPLLLLGHSNGGLIALRLVQSRRHVVDGLILSSPLVALQRRHRPVPAPLAALVASVAGRFPLRNGLDRAELSHDPAILERHRRDRLCHGWTTPAWYAGALAAMAWTFASLAAVRVPVLVLAAGQDPIVVPQAVVRLFEGMPSADKELVMMPNALHELLNEVGREETYRKIVAWIGARWSTSAAA